MSQLYVIESIRNLDGKGGSVPHECEARRKGQRVELLRCENGAPLLVCYRDDHNKILRTSAVQSVLHTDGDENIAVYTQNTVYTFGKVAV
ncbi:hypothetical protein [Paenibacillus graminis]|uniref:hypothetical protein n=1 Tax=Paenibacillus graminis TaxID=189425 RepID=UPI002DBA479B|nr:hypothetical protein [Paenibacillus graminis]MEC0167897.1 hypothetical protein [Paenibacillus graminis]